MRSETPTNPIKVVLFMASIWPAKNIGTAEASILNTEKSSLNAAVSIRECVRREHHFPQFGAVPHSMAVLLTNASILLSGDQEGTLIVPCPPYT